VFWTVIRQPWLSTIRNLLRRCHRLPSAHRPRNTIPLQGRATSDRKWLLVDSKDCSMYASCSHSEMHALFSHFVCCGGVSGYTTRVIGNTYGTRSILGTAQVVQVVLIHSTNPAFVIMIGRRNWKSITSRGTAQSSHLIHNKFRNREEVWNLNRVGCLRGLGKVQHNGRRTVGIQKIGG